MYQTSSVLKSISIKKGGDSFMKKLLGLSLMIVLFASMSFGAITDYSFSTSLAINVPGDGGNKCAGTVIYNPDLNAVFVGMYFTGVGSRANMCGWSMDTADITYGTVTPKYIIRDRMFPNGDKMAALKAEYGNGVYQNGKMYFVCDLWMFNNLNMVGRKYSTVNADSVTITFPDVSASYPLYNVTGVSTTALTAVEDTYNTTAGQQLYAGSAVITTAAFTCAANGWQVNLPDNNRALVGVTGVWTDYQTTYTRESSNSVSGTTVQTLNGPIIAVTGVWTTSGGTGLNFAAATTVTRQSLLSDNATQVTATILPVNTVTGVWTNATGLGFNYYSGPGNSFVSGSGVITLNSATTLSGAGVSVWVSYTAQIATITGPNTITLNGPALPGAGTPVWTSYAANTIDFVGGVPGGLGTNFWTGGGWDEAPRVIWVNTLIPAAPRTVYVNYTDGKYDPWTGVIDLAVAHTPGQQLFVHVGQLQPGMRAIWKYDATTLAAETALNIYGHPVMWEPCTVATVYATSPVGYELGGMLAPITDQFIAGRNPGFDTAKSRLTYTNYGRDTIIGTSLSATQIQLNVAGKPISGFYGVYTDAALVGQNFWGAPTCAEWVAVTDVNKVTCPWGPIKNVTGIYTDVTRVGVNFLVGEGVADTTSRLRGVGPGGYWSISPTTPEIFAATGGIDTTLSLGSAFVVYTGEAPDNNSPIVNNLMDTTGIANLTIALPGAAIPLWADVNRANGIDVANNRVRVVGVANTPTLAVGDTAYICYLKQAGANPYAWTGAGTAGNRGPNRNPYGVALDKDGNYFLQTLWNDAGFHAYAANGDHIAKYPIRGSLSTVIRGQISCDTTNGNIYVADGGGVVWRWTKSGPGLDTYTQENLPFYLGACKGTATAGLRAQTNALRVKTVTAQVGGSVTLVYLGTVLNNNATTPGENILTVMRTDGTIDAVYSSDALAAGPTPRGADVTPDGKQVIFGNWAGPAGYAQASIWTSPLSPVPVELSRFETLIN
jgi:hypothetical protein